ncbi:MAG: hypothetical protein LBJ78_04245 [Puniceicoccales bacterium]|jgi:hypothetical protein|nr:hypothetical protein [Puniceicoccales bacterium]
MSKILRVMKNMRSFFKNCTCLFIITVITVNSLFAMPTYTDWKQEAQNVLPPHLNSDAFLGTNAIIEQCLDVYTDVWEEMCTDYTKSFEAKLPTMHVLCILGYFLVKANLLSVGNALAGVNYVLRLLNAKSSAPEVLPTKRGQLSLESIGQWKFRFEEIQRELMALLKLN